MSKRQIVLRVACDPAVFDGATQFPITIAKPPVIEPKPKPFIPGPPMTIGKEVDEAIYEWYSSRGLAVPPDELEVGALIDTANAAEEAAFISTIEKAEEELPSVVPSYGTPEFWDYHRKKKELENKRRAAAGLPPLPTKKELQAEKEKKRAEKAAKTTRPPQTPSSS